LGEQRERKNRPGTAQTINAAGQASGASADGPHCRAAAAGATFVADRSA
jgi:hypothetical protein